ncbi:MAG: leucine-rich repeat domain-containing protein [Aphanocapsa feldmannii 277cV]|uniref:Leucine-rich repeat domain-containing protein n=1 Tax=Aphanocapsa feldmannii 277cV TaxID=2507553 RepID=A0A524RMV2_9CHRO|nr:MAG: leucine-rich repeat domain-containing protein [Aphanocapsa feldmannii 277cV]
MSNSNAPTSTSSFSWTRHINFSRQTFKAWASSLAWATPTLAALFILSPSAHSQIQNICERLDALSSNRKICNLSSKGITSLSSGDFDGLSNLKQLWLNKNDLSSLPEDIFAGLSNLRVLYLNEMT